MAIATAWPEARGQNRPCRGIIPPLLRSWSVPGRRARMAWIAERRRQSRFEAVVLPHLDAGFALARWLTRNDADAADVVQEACLRAFRYFDSYREGDAKSWLLKIVRRTCYDWIERNRPADLVPLETETDPAGGVHAPLASGIDTDALLQSLSDLRRLDKLIEALPPPLREAIVLRELHELDYRQIAEVTGVPIGTVMSRLHRARSALRRAWDGKGKGCGGCVAMRSA